MEIDKELESAIKTELDVLWQKEWTTVFLPAVQFVLVMIISQADSIVFGQCTAYLEAELSNSGLLQKSGTHTFLFIY